MTEVLIYVRVVEDRIELCCLDLKGNQFFSQVVDKDRALQMAADLLEAALGRATKV